MSMQEGGKTFPEVFAGTVWWSSQSYIRVFVLVGGVHLVAKGTVMQLLRP